MIQRRYHGGQLLIDYSTSQIKAENVKILTRWKNLMNRKRNRHNDQLWNQTFNNVRDSQGNLSRTKLHQQSHNNNVITIILVGIIIVIAIFALIYGLANNTLGHGGNHHEQTTRVHHLKHRHHKSSPKKHSKPKDSNQTSLAPGSRSTSQPNGNQSPVSQPKVKHKSSQTSSQNKPQTSKGPNSNNSRNNNLNPKTNPVRSNQPSVPTKSRN